MPNWERYVDCCEEGKGKEREGMFVEENCQESEFHDPESR